MLGGAGNSASDDAADDVLACAADLINNATTTSSRSGGSDQIQDGKGQISSGSPAQIDKNKEQTVKFSQEHTVFFEHGIEQFIDKYVQTIRAKKIETRMTQNQEEVEDQVSLKEVAAKVFEDAFSERFKLMKDKFLEGGCEYQISDKSKQ